MSDTIHRHKLDLFEKPILINNWSSTFESLTVLQIYFFVYRSYTWIIDIWIQTSVWLAGGLKGSKSRLHGNTGHQPSTYVQPEQLQIKRQWRALASIGLLLGDFLWHKHFIGFIIRGSLHGGSKILEGGSILRWVYMQKFCPMWYPNIECLRRN